MVKLTKQTPQRIQRRQAVSYLMSTRERRPSQPPTVNEDDDKIDQLIEVVYQLALAVSALQNGAQNQSQSSVHPYSALTKEQMPNSLAPEEEPPLYSPDISPRRYPVSPSMVNEIPLSNAASSYFYTYSNKL